ncbi:MULTISPECIES: RraA family protein [unclassified Paenibacillus]|uniref:RraA family protein n=1 Tax=unclassified Paenibacillus TaxID=185978 RepID=UPI001AE87D0D|nr:MULTISPECIES: RraA family protein [unclassified Paenibacillus]MBP1153600.1 3-hexulose-6-phosphate synthase/6-phospho-3-hexuloisomerase [Paenibacillus sp. PvP091]MBP1171015.1 3-hexulose-6-phosphate synthase/6-phospho-3-hexuloisomerase [Paenibacillus sp. PvR098]MBP2442043.1 3-hexulose-6-phosphate synthase/6-phospho-3-hexuloisomerase [Paenibacillus sp. PvP052]
MKKIINPRPEIDESKIKPFRDMDDVLSLSCVVGDAMQRNQVMRHDMKPKAAEKKIIGPAITVKLTAGDIVDCLEVFEVAKPGDVIVIDAFGETETSIWGGLMSGLARNAGVVGAVIDGSCRDTDESRMLGFPVTAKVSGPRAAHTAYSGRKEPVEINVPISCGGVIVQPGDLIVADEIGVAVVPYQQLEEVYANAREQADKEIATREEILKGASVEELLRKFGRI